MAVNLGSSIETDQVEKYCDQEGGGIRFHEFGCTIDELDESWGVKIDLIEVVYRVEECRCRSRGPLNIR